ncbi:MAG TPA: hypothetical protein VLK84_16740, partial [Longimicrobium sp.]|nr:hypothetical protein [Longimicrobium sp.]
MREQLRAIGMLGRTTWRTDPWRSAGLLLEPIAFLGAPLFAWFLKLMTDGALRQDLQLLVLGAAGITVTRVLTFVGIWLGSWIRIGLTERVGFAFDREIITLMADLPGLEHHERPDIQDRLELLRQKQGALGGALNVLVNAANTVVGAVGTLVTLAIVSPVLLLLVPFALPSIAITAAQQRWSRAAEKAFAEPSRRARYLKSLTVDRNAGMELRVFGLEREILSRFRQVWQESRRGALRVARRVTMLRSVGDLVFMAAYGGAVGLMLWRV